MGRSAARSWLLIAGWLLIAAFVVVSALLGRIGANVRLFQGVYVVGFAGYLALLWGLRSVPAPTGVGGWRWWLAGCLLLRMGLAYVEPNDDAYRYLWEGRVQRAGYNPFVHAPDDPRLASLRDDDWSSINHPDYPAIYGSVAQFEFVVVASLCPSIYVLKWLHVLWDFATVAVLGICLRRMGRRPHAAIAYGLCPLVLTAFAMEGHVDSLMLLLVALTLWAVIDGRVGLAGAMLGLAVATKPIALIFLPWFVLHDRRAAITAILVTASCYIPYAAAGPSLVSSLLRFGAGDEFFSMLGTFRLLPDDAQLARGIVAGMLAAVLLVLAWRRRPFTEYAGRAVEALLLLMPVVHYWYVAWMLLMVVFRARVRWLVMALGMVVYFEANVARETTGVWLMPSAPRLVVWLAFLATWLAETFYGASSIGRSKSREPVPQ